ncbi:MAG: hypothetical protein GX856_07920, partial [Gammaproteobacteria bacterium]|nr:hypothetical protein [Gammaproteobacteria bacterium]
MTARWWAVLACAVALGAARADAIDRAAEPLEEKPLAGAVLTLTEALGAQHGDGARASASARGRLRTARGERAVIVTRTRHGAAAPTVPRGARVQVSGRLVALGDGPGDRRLARSGVAGRVIAETVAWAGSRRGGVTGAIDRFAARAQQSYTDALGGRRGALVAGMALGLADGIEESDGDALLASGLWHLVAASGGNIALVIALALAAGWLMGWPDRARLGFAAICVAAYVPLAGAGPSIQRAGLMGLAALAALAAGREHRAIHALAIAAAVTLVWDPRAVLDVGWQLSFAAAAALVLGGSPLSRLLRRAGMPRVIAGGLACTLLASAATAPVMLSAFGEVSVIGVVANLLVMPLVGVCVWSGALAGLLAGISPGAAGLVVQPAGLAAGATLWISDWAAARSLAVTGLEGFALILVGGALVWAVHPPRVVVFVLAAGVLGFVALHAPAPPADPRVVVLDVGQGSATLLQDGAEGALIDAGPPDAGLVA